MAPPKPDPPESVEYVRGGWPGTSSPDRLAGFLPGVLVGGLVAMVGMVAGAVAGFALGRMF